MLIREQVLVNCKLPNSDKLGSKAAPGLLLVVFQLFYLAVYHM